MSYQQPDSKFKQTRTNTDVAEIISSLTPIFLACAGALIGIFALFLTEDNTKLTSAMGLAGTSIAGASGLAQSSNRSNKSKSNPNDSQE